MTPTMEIDRIGDLTLILSKNLTSTPEKSTRNLLISSKILTLASPVFTAMLSPRFREGQRSESGTLDPIALPDDDAEAVTTLCQLLHFRYDMLPSKPSLELFKNLAVLCDKYDCVAPLRFVSETWLVMWEATASSEDLEILLFVSFVFGRAERFAGISGRIVREFSGNLKRLATLGGFDAVPEELLRGLQQQRKAALKEIEAAISQQEEIMTAVSAKSFTLPAEMRSCISCLQFVQPTVQLCPKCRTSTAPAMCTRHSRRGEYVEHLRDAGLDPLKLWSQTRTKSINEIAACILRAQDSSVRHNCEGPTNCLLKNTFVLLNKDIATLASSMKGLCLDCIKNGNENVSLKPDCVIGHGKDGLVEAFETATFLDDA